MKPMLIEIKRLLASLVLLTACLGAWPATVLAGDDTFTDQTELRQTLAELFALDFRVLAYGTLQEPANSTQNPSNNFLQIPGYLADLELRPDLRLNLDALELSAKPRLKLEYSLWQEGFRKGESQWNDDWYLNEWLARWRMRENLFISYGRENLQWGPSFLFSPSNPFFQDNGRRNPYLEVPGLDFGRLVWIPGSSWSLSFIANTDEGRSLINGPDPFEKIYVFKLDYTGRQNYASLLLSHKEREDSLGFFGGWTISDAVLLYSEGVVSRGSRALYPRNNGSPFGAAMQKLPDSDSIVKPVLLMGGSYTLETMGTLTMEYVYYSPGYSSDEAEVYYSLRRKAAEAIGLGGLRSTLGQKVLGQTFNTGLRLLRRNYALLQYTQNNIRNNLDLTSRWTQNMDDGSGQFTTVLAYSLGKHMELFTVGTLFAGGKNSEFGSILDYQWMFGLKYTL